MSRRRRRRRSELKKRSSTSGPSYHSYWVISGTSHEVEKNSRKTIRRRPCCVPQFSRGQKRSDSSFPPPAAAPSASPFLKGGAGQGRHDPARLWRHRSISLTQHLMLVPLSFHLHCSTGKEIMLARSCLIRRLRSQIGGLCCCSSAVLCGRNVGFSSGFFDWIC